MKESIAAIRPFLTDDITLLAAAKKRTSQEIRTSYELGIQWIGMNYVQEAKQLKETLHDLPLHWSLIGALQKNKAKLAVQLFDRIETLHDRQLAEKLNHYAQEEKKKISVFIQVNIADEPQKNGVSPEECIDLTESLSDLHQLQIEGIMAMGPNLEDPENLRPYFKKAKSLFNAFSSLQQRNLSPKYLSMGMSSSYKVAIEEGANYIRLGTAIFGPRPHAIV